jgi:thymidylate synthase
MQSGKVNCARGKETLELENFAMTLHPLCDRFTSFKARKMNLEYAKFEMLWYLRGDRYEVDTIADKAQMWSTIVDTDGGINSNYGQYIFSGPRQYDWVVEELTRDADSRRAVMSLLNSNHLRQNNPDVVCTYSLGFRIRKNRLNMSIHMRSWDAVWGMTNDVFCFSVIYEIILNKLRATYPDLKPGTYHHTADSFHVYDRHYGMLSEILMSAENGYVHVECPRISGPAESDYLTGVTDTMRDEFAFSRWLNS